MKRIYIIPQTEMATLMQAGILCASAQPKVGVSYTPQGGMGD